MAARAIKGDRDYVLTYYKKSREERAREFRKVMPKLFVFTSDPDAELNQQLESKINDMDSADKLSLLKFLKDGKKLNKK